MKERFEIFTTQISKISRNIRRIKAEEMQEYNLKSPHVSTLYYLYKNGGTLTMKELCETCDEDKAAISRANKYLYKNDYISLTGSRFKKYKHPITLTEKGTEIAKQIANKIDKILGKASEGLTDANRKIFYESLILISDNLQAMTDKYDE